MTTTRALVLSDTLLLSWAGVGLYAIDLSVSRATPLSVAPSGQTLVYYEVAAAAQGSWWLPVAPQPVVPSAWYGDAFGGVEALEASGTGIPTASGSAPILRPARALIWIPAATLASATPPPTSVTGRVVGTFPNFAPASPPTTDSTRWLFLPDTQWSAWNGAGVYWNNGPGTAPSPLAYTPSGQALQFYEVARVAGHGSWWLPVSAAATAPTAWSSSNFGGVVPVQAQGSGIWTSEAGQARVRPATALWWLPREVLASSPVFVPGFVLGTLVGAFPNVSPSGASPGPEDDPPPTPVPGADDDLEDGPAARQAHFMGLRTHRTGALTEPTSDGRARAAGAARSRALRQHRTRLRAQPDGDAPMAMVGVPGTSSAAGSRRARLAQPARPGQVNWIPIGPSVVTFGQTLTHASVSGRVTGVAVSADGWRVYVGSANGGVWRSDDAGRTFYPLMNAFDLHPTANHADSLSVGALAIAPQRPDRVYVGSGEGSISDAYFGVGPVVSDDGGLNWRVERSTAQADWFFGLAVDPSDAERVLAGTSHGLLRRQPRNEGVAGLPAAKPQSYFVRYSLQAGSYSVNYWNEEGTAAFTVQVAGAATWPPRVTLVPLNNGGVPWLFRYQREASDLPPARGGRWESLRVEPDGTLTSHAAGTWSPNTTLMPFELGGQQHLLRYLAPSGFAALSVMETGGGFTQVWAGRQWEVGLTQLVPFVLGGIPHFLVYPLPVPAAAGSAMLRAWTGTGDVYDVWPAPVVLGAQALLSTFELAGVPFLQVYDFFSGDLRVARIEPGGRLTFIDEAHQTWPAGQALTTFTLGTQPRTLAYNGLTGVATVYTYDPNAVPVQLWSTRWAPGLRVTPFQMGYEWAARPVVAHSTARDAAIQRRATAVVVARRGITTAYYAAFWGGGVYRSTDGGATWARVGTNNPGTQGTAGGDNPFAGIGRVSLAVQPGEPSVIYAQIQNGQVFRYEATGSTPLARTWERIKGEPANYTGTQGDYDLVIAIAPDNVNRIYLGGSFVKVPLDAPREVSGSIWRADVTLNSVLSSTMAPVYIGAAAHADIHALVFTPGNPNALWAGTDGGLFFSSEPARPPDPTQPTALEDVFQARNTGLASMTVNAIGQHPVQDALVFDATQDNGAERYTGDAAWKLSFIKGDSGRVLVNQDPANNGQLVLGTYTRATLLRSIDGGNTRNAKVKLPLGVGDGSAFYAPLVAAPPSANMFQRVAFGARRPWISNNFGADGSWAALGNPLGNTNDFNATALAFSADGHTLYIGLTNGRIYSYTEAGIPLTWGAGVRIDQGLAGGAALPAWANVPITSLAIDPANAAGLYATLGGDLTAQMHGWQRVWHFDGNAWTACSGPAKDDPASLLNVQANSIVARPILGPATQLFVGADVGLWRSDDGGQHWQPFGSGLPEASVVFVELLPARNLVTTTPPTPIAAPALLRAATHGRGVYEYVLDPAARHARGVQLYLRCSILDRGLYPVQDGAADPTRPAHVVTHRDGSAFKVIQPRDGGDTDTFRSPPDITFEQFSKLIDANRSLRTNRRLRVYVQVDNRGVLPADKVRLSLLLSRRITPNVPAGVVNDLNTLAAPPGLPANYEQRVQANEFVVSADWNTKAILALDDVRVGLPEVVSIDLPPDTLRQEGVYCLLAIVHNPEDPFPSNERNVDLLTIDDSRVALAYLFATDP
jgi:hypothetical protein